MTVRVTPRASRTEIAGILDDGTVRIRVAAPPAEGKANKALLVFLAKLLGVKRNRIEIVVGDHSLDKLVSILDMTAADVEARIKDWLESQA